MRVEDVLTFGRALTAEEVRICHEHQRLIADVVRAAAKAEREECAKVAAKIAHLYAQLDPRHETGWAIHDAIRARGEVGG